MTYYITARRGWRRKHLSTGPPGGCNRFEYNMYVRARIHKPRAMCAHGCHYTYSITARYYHYIRICIPFDCFRFNFFFFPRCDILLYATTGARRCRRFARDMCR